MHFDEHTQTVLENLKKNPADPALMREAGNAYWNCLEENVARCIRDKTDLGDYFKQNYDFVNFGLSSGIFNDPARIHERICDGAPTNPAVKTLLISDWLSEEITKIMAGDRKDALEKEVAIAAMQVRTMEAEITSAQHQRRRLLLTELGGVNAAEQIGQVIEKMDRADALLRYNQKIKKISAKGVFVPAAEKRKHCEREKEFTACCDHIDHFLSSMQSRETQAAIKQFNAQVRDAVAEIIDNDDAIARLKNEIADVAKKQRMLSTAELSASMSKEIEYGRDLVKLSAKRLRAESCAMLKPGDAYFTMKELSECVDRILEFDPMLFNNSRVQIFGVPGILLAPGAGNALYDWKNNRIVVPLTAPGGNFMASVAFGMIEYRLDVDETKQLLASYNKLPQHAGVKSIFNLKNELTKDYITWMTSEYRGYKNLTRETRKWFEHEIAPGKNDIAVPLHLRSFFLTTEQFNAQYKEIETQAQQGLTACGDKVLWNGGILAYQQGKFERAMDFFKALIDRKNNHAMAWYNLGHTYMKLMRKQEAIDALNEFCKQNPQSWWTSVAVEHLRRLQTGHAT